jgi:hypothetical protein
MRLAWQNLPDLYNLARITDNGASTDTVALGYTTTLAGAEAWVNRGYRGSGVTDSAGWGWYSVSGDYTITASQA